MLNAIGSSTNAIQDYHSITQTCSKSVQFSRPPTHVVELRLKFSGRGPPPPVDLGPPVSNKTPPSQNDNQSIKRKYNPGMTIICYQVGFCFQFQLINLVWLSIDFFAVSQPFHQSYFKKLKTSFSHSLTTKRCAVVKVELKLHYLLFHRFIFFYVQLLNNITKCFLFIIIRIFSTHFAINLFYLHVLKT